MAETPNAAGPGGMSASGGTTTARPARRKWRVLVFMGTHTIVGNAPLDDAADADLLEMMHGGASERLDIFVQCHGDRDPWRMQVLDIDRSVRQSVPPDQREVADGRALMAFIEWGLGLAPDSPLRFDADANTMLIFWGHAYQFAIGHELRPDGSIDALDFGELEDVFTRFSVSLAAREPGAARKLDIIAFDACDLASVEMACQLAPFADYLLASERGVPIPGWPYDRIFDRLKKPQGDRVMGPAELGTYAVRRYCEAYRAKRPVSLSLLDLRKADELVARTEALARELAVAFTLDPAERGVTRELMARAQTDDNKPFIDLADFCLNLMRESGAPPVRRAAEALGDFLISPDPVPPDESADGTGRPFIVEHGRNAAGTAKLNGVSLFAPHVALAVNPSDRAIESGLYRKFAFSRRSIWGQLVEGLAVI